MEISLMRGLSLASQEVAREAASTASGENPEDIADALIGIRQAFFEGEISEEQKATFKLQILHHSMDEAVFARFSLHGKACKRILDEEPVPINPFGDLSDVPPQFVCPITREIFSEPCVSIVSGISYEKSVFKKWLEEHGTDPQTRQQVQRGPDQAFYLPTNRNLADSIDDWIAKEKKSGRTWERFAPAVRTLIDVFGEVSTVPDLVAFLEGHKDLLQTGEASSGGGGDGGGGAALPPVPPAATRSLAALVVDKIVDATKDAAKRQQLAEKAIVSHFVVQVPLQLPIPFSSLPLLRLFTSSQPFHPFLPSSLPPFLPFLPPPSNPPSSFPKALDLFGAEADPHMASICVRAILRLSATRSSSAKALLGRNGAPTALVKAMAAHPSNTEVTKIASMAMYNLLEEGQHERFVSAGAIQACQAALSSIPVDSRDGEEARSQISDALQRLLLPSPPRMPPMETVDEVLAVVRNTELMASPTALRAILRNVGNLCDGGGSATTRLGSDGMCEAYVNALRPHLATTPAESELARVWAMSLYNLAGSQDNVGPMLGAGVLEVCDAIKNSAALSEQAKSEAADLRRKLERRVTVNPDRDVTLPTSPAELVAFVADNAANQASAEVCRVVLKTIGNNTNGDMRRQFGEQGACELVTVLMERHTENAEVRRVACMTGYNLCAEDFNRARFMQTNARALCDAMLSDPGLDEDIKAEARDFRRRMRIPVTAPLSPAEIMTSARALPSPPPLEGAKAIAVAVAHTISKIDTAAVALGRDGCCQVLVDLVRAHRDDEEMAEQGCVAILRLAQADGNRDELVRVGCLEVVVEGLRAHSGSSGLVRTACIALWNLVNTGATRSALRALGADAVLQQIVSDARVSGTALNEARDTLRKLRRP